MDKRFELPRVKVCGLARMEDVAVAVDSGADALGFVFHPASPRCLESEEANELIAVLPPYVVTVAVVVDIDPTGAESLLRATGASTIQLCGFQEAADWKAFSSPILRRVPVDETGQEELERWLGVASGFVLDHPAAAGGTGETVDLELAARLAAHAPCLLAGGLGPDNVAEAIRAVRPGGVDASSRLESSPGSKSPERVDRYVRQALSTFQDLEPSS